MQLDAIFTHARVTTLDPSRPTAQRIGVLGGRVVGFDEELDGVRAAHVVDLGGAPVVPGFNDAHHHLSAYGLRMLQVDLRADAVATLDELYRRVGEHAAGLPADAWVLGAGYDQNKLGSHPDRDRLDQVGGGRPVFLAHISGHLGAVNSAALARMGFGDGQSVEVAGGKVYTDAGGRPNGLLAERAVEIAYECVGPAAAERFVEALGLAGRGAVAAGLTSITEPGIGIIGMLGNNCADLAGFAKARQQGLLPLRANVMPAAELLREIDAFEPGQPWFGLDLGLASGFGDEWLKISAVKFMLDGSLIGRTANMTEPFADTPGQSGYFRGDPDVLTDQLVKAHRHGWQIAAHAVGDATVDLVIDAYEKAQRLYPRPDPRHRIEHCAVARPEQLARIAAVGAIPVPQGRFIHELGDGFIRALGSPRSEWCFRAKSFLEAGLPLPGSSDCPVASGDPLLGIQSMVDRRTADGRVLGPEEVLTPLEALQAYTTGSAYAAHEEKVKGTLSTGKLADFVVLSDDILQVDPERIGAITVGATIVGGHVQHDAGAVVSA